MVSPHLETVSLGFVVVLAALGCTCGFERWPEGEARALLNLLLDVTEGAFVVQAEQGFPERSADRISSQQERLFDCCLFESLIFKGEFSFESGTFLGPRGDRFLLLS